MKTMKSFLLMLAIFISTSLFSQTKFEMGMQKGFEQMSNAKSVADMQAASAFFERIADAEKDKWLPYYYAAQSIYFTGWMDPKADKDKVGNKCKELIAKAEAIESNSELFCLKQMAAILQMTVDPMARFQTYGAEASAALENATKADPNNPRIYFLSGQTLFNTPEAYGGGKSVAKKLYEKALVLYKTFTPASPFHPNWGKEETEKALAACL